MLAPWEQLQTAYTTSVGVSDKLSFVTSAGQRLVAEMTCAQLQELGGISTIYVMPAVVTPPPEDEEDGEEQGQEEKGLVKGFFDGFEEIVADDSTDDLVAQDSSESCRPRTRLVTPEVRLFPQLQEREKIKALFPRRADNNEKLISPDCSIRRRDLRTLRGRNWLNDEIIDGYNVDKVHWTLAVINLKLRRFEYYDSLGGTNQTALSNLRLWLNEESKAKRGVGMALDDWEDFCPQGEVPQQSNRCDCGVFTLQFADCVALSVPFDFQQAGLPNLRLLVMLQLLKQSLSV